ncbi:hypothetical protein AVEN_7192-1 [Araneus ventricosus]|uniref:Uncharacterized protein n=1 Tax=Araneus ventricosus TaxID=182803 RepID=A0A4Y2R359_ARAVE|nr:hypothetical protein AVEN_7192-1 [Araneus ventricosus]
MRRICNLYENYGSKAVVENNLTYNRVPFTFYTGDSVMRTVHKLMKTKMNWDRAVSQKVDNELKLSPMVMFDVDNIYMPFRKHSPNIREDIKVFLKKSQLFPHVLCL